MWRTTSLLLVIGVVLSMATAPSVDAAASEVEIAGVRIDDSIQVDDRVQEGAAVTRISVDGLSSGVAVSAGPVRSTLAPGSIVTIDTGSAPMVILVEEGVLAVRLIQGDVSPRVIRRGVLGGEASPEAAASAGAEPLGEGDATVLAPGSTTIVQNEGDRPAESITLLSAADAKIDADGDVVSSVLAAGRYAATSPSVELTIERRTLAPGEMVDRSASPTETIAAAVVRAQGAKLGTSAAGYVNRDDVPMPIYVVTITGLGRA